MEKKNKEMRLKGAAYRASAVAIDVPGNDVAVYIAFKVKMSQNDAERYKLQVKKSIREWFFDSTMLSPDHLIISFEVPSGYQNADRIVSMKLKLHLNVCTRKQIQMGLSSFKEIFEGELRRLIEYLGLE